MAWLLIVFIGIPLIGLAAILALLALVEKNLADAREPGSLERRLAPLREEGAKSGLWQRIEDCL